MKEEKLIDAMALLPEEMLEDTQKLRQRKPRPWKGIAALAACLCLVAGLWLTNSDSKSTESASNSMADTAGSSDGGSKKYESYSQIGTVLGHEFCDKEYVDVTIIAVRDGFIGVVKGWNDSSAIDGIEELIATSLLENPSDFSPGQHLRIYFSQPLEAYMDTTFGKPVFIPDRIEIHD